MRKLALALLIAGAALFAAGAASAGHGDTVVTDTQNFHGSFTDTGASNPCDNNAPMAVTFDGNAVFHNTLFFAPGVDPNDPNSVPDNVWFTGTETGKVTGQEFTDPNDPFGSLVGPVYSGRATVWFNFNLNERNANETFTLTIKATAPGGLTLIGHEVSHVNFDSTFTPTLSFDKPSWTCGS
jgi:hypothetical protein